MNLPIPAEELEDYLPETQDGFPIVFGMSVFVRRERVEMEVVVDRMSLRSDRLDIFGKFWIGGDASSGERWAGGNGECYARLKNLIATRSY